MVLTRRVGKERPFWRGLLLAVVTFGLYRYYWLYKAQNEVFKQYELDREGRDEGIVWLVLGIVVPVVRLVYDYKFADNVGYVRDRMRLPRRMTPGKFVGLQIAGALLVFVGIIAAMGVLPDVVVEGDPEGNAELTDSESARFATGVALYLGGFVGFAAFVAVAYYGLQRDINETWRWYDSHMTAFTSPGGPPGQPPMYLPQYSAAAPPLAPTLPPPPPVDDSAWAPPEDPVAPDRPREP